MLPCSQPLSDVKLLKCYIFSDFSWLLTFLYSVLMGLFKDVLLILQRKSLLEKVAMFVSSVCLCSSSTLILSM